jgi:asparagine synthetase B (glutamine-hydrolysing)
MENINSNNYLEFRRLFLKNTEKSIKDSKSISLAFSGGIDSISIFFALIELKADFECYTVYQDGIMSEDYTSSVSYCKQFGIKLNEIKLSSDLDSVYEDIKSVLPFCGKKILKTKVETLRPLKHLFEQCNHELILNGLSADDYQPYKRKVNVLYIKGGDELVLKSGYRKSLDNKIDSMEVLSKEMAKHYSKRWVDVYADKEIEDYFLRFYLKDVLYPHKNLVVGAFADYFEKVNGFRRHSSYQVNSKLRDVHELLLKSKYNTKNHKAIIGLYNEIDKQNKQLKLF